MVGAFGVRRTPAPPSARQLVDLEPGGFLRRVHHLDGRISPSAQISLARFGRNPLLAATVAPRGGVVRKGWTAPQREHFRTPCCEIRPARGASSAPYRLVRSGAQKTG